jgi:hypothetical protein
MLLFSSRIPKKQSIISLLDLPMMHPNGFFVRKKIMHANDHMSLERYSSLSDKMHKMEKRKKLCEHSIRIG